MCTCQCEGFTQGREMVPVNDKGGGYISEMFFIRGSSVYIGC